MAGQTVYVVAYAYNETFELERIFDSREKAEAYREQQLAIVSTRFYAEFGYWRIGIGDRDWHAGTTPAESDLPWKIPKLQREMASRWEIHEFRVE